MIDVNFEAYGYYPTLRTRQAELKGLEMLDRARKEQILPLLTLGRWPRALDFNRAAEKARDCMSGLPYFLDLTDDGSHLAEQQVALRNPESGFAAWQRFFEPYPGAIPVIQTLSNARDPNVIRQVVEFERERGKVAFRIKDFSVDTPAVIDALAAMDDYRNAVVFIDCMYIRNALSAYVAATVTTIDSLRARFPEVFIAVLSTSFPLSTVRFADSTQQRGSIDILERTLHSTIGGDAVAAYGDHGSIHSVVYDDTTIMTWAARIDYPRELDWYFERRPKDQSVAGYVACARAIAELEQMGHRDIWGEEMILLAAEGRPHAKAPAPWISVRVNIHLARQIDFSARIRAAEDYPPDEDLEE